MPLVHISQALKEFYSALGNSVLGQIEDEGLESVACSEGINTLLCLGGLDHSSVYRAEEIHKMNYIENN
ncbi:MAG: hypothetical protein Q8N99_08040 [Nanoarchaeota archaeon]|nr:hypothetical protein [Nanoarchaeota archaeon]